mmetsp:Transcript_30198/g.73492  ORF Transcript_30198/g.73492 Transcript_30198/m.73492 type:complete len:1022 (-) Transcript_30198:219-3284(-)|eukprot:CAMPEP_0114522662 /NCGR_PEP_ID=MMETSP0109-20121206/20859_1 /TAXON_ID=29199 /ORGANISM="Chlorarachnion reptans, Strain CCCM449" /LENGTH=1021 /DNA_ID=CAMNT_0001703889 /DNA_START=123 /DNA_END=3188 /DNA_ORIENTATION=+
MASAQTGGRNDVDEGLYSRQLYVFGHEAQRRMQQSAVLLLGLNGLGVEIAKNIILAGVKAVGLHDPTPCTERDRGSQFYVKTEDVGKPCDKACRDALAELNSYVNVHVAEGKVEDLISSKKYSCVVAVGKMSKERASLNDLCRKCGMQFIAADVHGLLGSIFVDLGPRHVVSDADGERPKRGLIKSISSASPAIVTTDSRHGLSTGDFVTFDEVKGELGAHLNGIKATEIKNLSPASFSVDIDATKLSQDSKGGGYFEQVKCPKELKFQPLAQCNSSPKFSSDMGEMSTLHALFNALSDFKAQSGALPSPKSKSDAEKVADLAQKFASSHLNAKIDAEVCKKLARTAGAVIAPMAAVIGGIAGQEILKATSGKFTPIQQFYYFSAAKCLPSDAKSDDPAKTFAGSLDRYHDYVSIFGTSVQERVAKLRIFLVGAGAIGCEMMKNFSLMGIASSEGGVVTVTDMDAIERSNLNRQFLFRPNDVGSLKSEIAAREAKKMNPQFNVVHQSHRVGEDTENIYNSTFWNGLSTVVTALDNVQARLYLDGRCIFFSKPMFDSGTLGTKGNTQVVLPKLTESYGSSQDPPEESIPLCTLHNFPHKIEHTIQWARDKFEGLYKNVATEVNGYITNMEYLNKLAEDPVNEVKTLQLLNDNLGKDKPLSFEDCVHWARRLFETEFHNKILQLITALPPDQVDSEGNPFWTGHKRPPTPLKFDKNNPLHIDFVIAAANLRARMYGLKGGSDRGLCTSEAEKTEIVPFAPIKGRKVAKTDEEMKAMMELESTGLDTKTLKLRESLPAPSTLTGYRLEPIEFEKDDPTNFHIDFITACSNLRAVNYKIKTATKHQTKQIAGKIIPAIATTTALVSGLVCLELYKLVQSLPLDAFSNTYANLAVAHITASEPFEPAFQTVELKGGKKFKFSLWDRMEVKLGKNATLQQLCDHFESEYGLQIVMLSFGKAMLFMKFGFMAKKKNKTRMKLSIPELVKTVAKVDVDTSEPFLMMEAMATTMDDEDVEIPSVRFWMNF